MIDMSRMSQTACPSAVNLMLKNNYVSERAEKYYSSSKISPLRPTIANDRSDLVHTHKSVAAEAPTQPDQNIISLD